MSSIVASLNEQMVRMLRAIGYDVRFCRGQAVPLRLARHQYLDLLRWLGCVRDGRNHPFSGMC